MAKFKDPQILRLVPKVKRLSLHIRKAGLQLDLCLSLLMSLTLMSLPGSSVAAYTSRPLSLEDAIRNARIHDPARIALLAQKASLLAQSSQVKAPAPPVFTFGVGDLSGRPGPENSGLRIYELSQTLGFPGKASTAAHSLKLDADAIQLEIEAEDAQIEQKVRLAFNDLWLTQQKLEINAFKRSAYEKILAAAKIRLVRNTSTEVEYLSTLAMIQRIQNERTDLETAEKIARLNLNLLLGTAKGQPLNLTAPPEIQEPLKMDPIELQKELLENNPTLLANRTRIEAAQSRVSEARKSYLPDFTLVGGINSFGAGAGSISATLPLWFWWDQRSAVRASRASRDAEQANADAQRLSLVHELQVNVAQANGLVQKIRTYRSGLIPTSARAFEIALKNYRFGKIDNATLTMAVEGLVSSKLELNDLLSQYLTAKEKIDTWVGKRLP